MMIYPAFYRVVYQKNGIFNDFLTEFLSAAEHYFWHCVMSGCDYVCLKAINHDDTIAVGLMVFYKDEKEGDDDVRETDLS